MKRSIISGIAVLAVIIFCVYMLCFHENETITTSANSNNPYKILVDVEESKMYVFENDVCIKKYTCAGGKRSTPSPIGTWTIVSKGKWGEGFGGSWLRL